MQARLRIAGGDLASATEWVQERGLGVDDEADYLHEYEELTLARLAIAQHHAGSVSAEVPALPRLLPLLDRLQAHATAAERHGSVLEVQVVRALALVALDDPGAALSALAQAICDVPEPEGYVRVYLDEGAPMLDLLRLAADSGRGAEVSIGDDARDRAVRDRARRLLAMATSEEIEAPHQSLLDPLTDREVEVLRLLASDLTGPQIARQLFVSLNTFRTHSKRIFTKLDVTTRAAAVRRGEGLGLLG